MHYDIELANSEPTWTAVVLARVRPTELAQFVPAACGEAWAFIRATGIPRPGRNLALYLADGSVAAGAEVSGQFAGNARVHCSQLPAGRVAHTVHYGPYSGLSEAHAAMQKWCAEQGHRRTGDSWELYGHWQERWHAEPSNIRTDVFQLLDERSG